jgi:hypothetical protein
MSSLLSEPKTDRSRTDGEGRVAPPHGADPAGVAQRLPVARRSHFTFPRGSDALLILAILQLGVLLLVLLHSSFSVDSWLELAAGREIWGSGIPQHDTLTVIAQGMRWIDQQWLAQLASYALYRLGGIGLLGVVSVTLMVSAVGGAVWGARRLGADCRSILVMLPLALWLVIPSREVRTQDFATPLFVITAYLLASDSRRPSARVYWCFPILILWANLHGTVTFGVGLVALRGVTMAWERRGQPSRSWWRWVRPTALVVIAPLCLLVTPYGLHIVSYYHATLGNSALKRDVTEWRPITSDPILAGAFVVLTGITAWSFVRRPGQTTMWDKLALITLAAATADAVRAGLLFALLALMLLPTSLNTLVTNSRRGNDTQHNRLNAGLLLALGVALLTLVATTVARPPAYFDGGSGRQRVLDVVRSAVRSDPRLHVMADVLFADWLLWKDPELRGKVVIDARFEILPTTQLDSLVRMVDVSGNWKEIATGARLLVLDRKTVPATVRAFVAEPGRRILYDDGDNVVILRSRQEADGLAGSRA